MRRSRLKRLSIDRCTSGLSYNMTHTRIRSAVRTSSTNSAYKSHHLATAPAYYSLRPKQATRQSSPSASRAAPRSAATLGQLTGQQLPPPQASYALGRSDPHRRPPRGVCGIRFFRDHKAHDTAHICHAYRKLGFFSSLGCDNTAGNYNCRYIATYSA